MSVRHDMSQASASVKTQDQSQRMIGLEMLEGARRAQIAKVPLEGRAARQAEKKRQKAVQRGLAEERKRSAKTGFSNPSNPQRSWRLTIVTGIFAIYCLLSLIHI